MKTYYYGLLILSSLITISFTSCEKENSKNNNQVLIPLKQGNKWTYESHRGTNTSSAVIEIGENVNINGHKGYKFLSGIRAHNATFLVDNDADGNFVLVGGYSDLDTLISPSINYKLNAKKNDSWNCENIEIINDNGIFKKNPLLIYCINTDTTITTVKGNFKCMMYKYSPNSGADVFINYFSVNFGIIKSEHYENNKLNSFMTLTDYQLK